MTQNDLVKKLEEFLRDNMPVGMGPLMVDKLEVEHGIGGVKMNISLVGGSRLPHSPSQHLFHTANQMRGMYGHHDVFVGDIEPPPQPEIDIHAGHEIIDNVANGKPFKYCRNCKVEVF